MLEKIRQIAHYKLFKLFFFALAFIFAISLGSFRDASNKENIVAIVGKEKIPLAEFDRARKKEIANLNSKQHLSAEQIEEEAKGLNRVTLNKLISQYLIQQEVKSLGIAVPDEVIATYIHNDPSFQNNSVFDIDLYKRVLRENNLTEEALIANLSNQTASRFLIESISSNYPLKNTLSTYMKNYIGEKRLVSIVKVDSGNVELNDISEDKIKEFYNKNPNYFQSKQLRSFKYIKFGKSDIKLNNEITEDMLLNEYKNNREDYALPEKRDLYHFLTPDQQTAMLVVNELRKNDDHIKVAKNFIDKKVIGEKFVSQNKDSFLATIDNSIFFKKEGEITNPVKSELGWHVFKVIKVHPLNFQEYSKVKNQVQERLLNKLYEVQIFDLAKQIEDEISSGADFKEIGERFSLKVNEVKLVSNEGVDANLKKLELNPSILEVAFETVVNEESPIKMIEGSNDMFVVKVDEVQEPSLIPYDKVRNSAKALLVNSIKSQLAYEISASILMACKNKDEIPFNFEASTIDQNKINKSINGVIKKYNIKDGFRPKLEISKLEISRYKNDEKTSPDLVNNLFLTAMNGLSFPMAIDHNIYAFGKVLKSIFPTNNGEDLTKIAEYLSEANYKNEIVDQYLEYLRKKYPIKINQKILNTENE